MNLVVWGVALLVVLVVLMFLGLAIHRIRQQKSIARQKAQEPVEKTEYSISYVPSEKEWSGSPTGSLPLKTLTYKQYECLEDARYGFKIVGVTPSQRKEAQPHKTRAHGQKTVASLARHGFLALDGDVAYAITDHGLQALEVCSVRY